jgi:hypothetical protein
MMPRRETIGTGITQRQRVTYDPRDAGDLDALQRMKFPERFDTIERWCRETLRAAGLPDDARFYTKRGGRWQPVVAPLSLGKVLRIAMIAAAEGHDEDSDVGYAARCLEVVELELKPAIAAGNAKSAANAGLMLGLLLMQSYVKGRWEKPALAGDNSGRAGRENSGNEMQKRDKDERTAALRAQAQKMRARNPGLSNTAIAQRLAKTCGLSVSTIRKLIRQNSWPS